MARVSRKQNKNTEILSGNFYKVGVYIRLSKEDERKKLNDSIGSQRSLVLEKVNSLDDVEIVGIYEDKNFSGTNFNRPAFENLIKDIKSKKINCVVVKDLSRLGRNYLETGHYLEYVFPFLDVRFISVTENFDTLYSTSNDTFILPMKNLMNEMYSRDLSKKIRSVRLKDRKNGIYCGTIPPYGFILKDRKLIIDEDVKDNVIKIFELAKDGMGIQSIVKYLNDNGIESPASYLYRKNILKTQPKSGTWGSTAITRMLANKAYIGTVTGGKRARSCFDNVVVDTTEYVHENCHEAIIKRELFEAVGTIRAINYHKYKNMKNNEKKPNEKKFQGILFCGDCKRPMIRFTTKAVKVPKRNIYLCVTHEQVSSNLCTRKYLEEKVVEEVVWDVISKQFELFFDIEREINKRSDNAEKLRIDKIKVELNRIQKRLKDINMLETELYNDYKDGVLSSEDYVLLKKKYREETEKLKAEHSMTTIENDSSKTGTLIEIMNKFKHEKVLTRALIEALVEKIVYSNNGEFEITLKFSDQLSRLKETLGV